MIPAVHTEQLSRTYGETVALKDITIDIKQNAITGLLGRNGAGKTTLMSLITAQDRATSGSVRVFGHEPFEHTPTLSHMCFIRDNQRYPDDYKIHHALRAAKLFFPRWDQALAEELVDLFRIPRKTIISKFSRGQFSAVGITLGLASRAPLTFFDEPYLGLDATARGLFYDVLLREYAEHPRTIVLSTHLIDEMERLLERVIILDQGRVVRDADVEDLRGDAHQVAGLLDPVSAYLDQKRVLKRHLVGGLVSAVVEGQPSEEDRKLAERTGVTLSPVSLQELVAALGLHGSEEVAAEESATRRSRKGA